MCFFGYWSKSNSIYTNTHKRLLTKTIYWIRLIIWRWNQDVGAQTWGATTWGRSNFSRWGDNTSTRLRGIYPTNTVFCFTEPCAEEYCLQLNFRISQRTPLFRHKVYTPSTDPFWSTVLTSHPCIFPCIVYEILGTIQDGCELTMEVHA